MLDLLLIFAEKSNNMNLTDYKALASYTDPIEMPVSELLAGGYEFSIPSYQRGYRWESSEAGTKDGDVKQVDDLLNDLIDFVVLNTGQEANYYLQPLMVKPRLHEDGHIVWDVLDGQQRLTTMLLILKCLKEKLNLPNPLYELSYENRRSLDFGNLTFDNTSPNYDYPSPAANLDSYFIRKAKDRIARWYDEVVAKDSGLADKLKEMLFYADATRGQTSVKPSLRALFIWYNVKPLQQFLQLNGERMHDIEIFNRLNRGKIGLTDSELIKALFLLYIKLTSQGATSVLNAETLVRRWDEMGKKFQDDEFWAMLSPNNKTYDNRLDMLFEFIKECKGSDCHTPYRYYYAEMHDMLRTPDDARFEKYWEDIKSYFDTLCKWHEDVHVHNFVGFLVANGMRLADIYAKRDDLRGLAKARITRVEDIDTLNYRDNGPAIRNILLMFNILTCDRYGQKFPFNLYRSNLFDIEHINPQTDNPIEKIDEKVTWVKEHAIAALEVDMTETDGQGNRTLSAIEAECLKKEGEALLEHFIQNNNHDTGDKFKGYRAKVENYYASGSSASSMPNKDAIGNLTLLNASINREYKNALFPKKVRTVKCRDQEGAYIPLCTKYMFLKYYSNSQLNASAFSMMRWRPSDQEDYTNAIKELINTL